MGSANEPRVGGDGAANGSAGAAAPGALRAGHGGANDVNGVVWTAEMSSRPRWMRQHVALLVALDALAAASAMGLARLLTFGLDPARLMIRSVTIGYGWVAAALVPTWLAVLAITGAYDVGPFGTAVRGRRVIRAAADFLALVAVAYFVLHLEELGRGFLAAGVSLAVLCTLAFRWVAGWVLRARRRRGLAVRRAVIVGSRGNVGEIVRRLAVRRSTELLPLAACTPGPRDPFVVNGRRVPVLGGPDDVLAAVESAKADTLVLAGDLAHGRVRSLAWALEGSGVDVFVVPVFAHEAMEIDVRPVAGLPLVYVDPGRRAGPSRGDDVDEPAWAQARSAADGAGADDDRVLEDAGDLDDLLPPFRSGAGGTNGSAGTGSGTNGGNGGAPNGTNGVRPAGTAPTAHARQHVRPPRSATTSGSHRAVTG